MYFYIKETPGQEDATYQRVIALQHDLQEQNLKNMFSSKEDAMKLLSSKIPQLSIQFSALNMENPLPSTLYVMFGSTREYQQLKTIILTYKDIILNTKELDQGVSLQDQELKNLTIINLVSFVGSFIWAIVGFFVLFVLFTLLFLTHMLGDFFSKELHLQYLFGGSIYQTAKEFGSIQFLTLILGFLLCFVLLLLTELGLSVAFSHLFDVRLVDFFFNKSILIIFAALAIEFIFFSLCSFGYATYFVTKKQK